MSKNKMLVAKIVAAISGAVLVIGLSMLGASITQKFIGVFGRVDYLFITAVLIVVGAFLFMRAGEMMPEEAEMEDI